MLLQKSPLGDPVAFRVSHTTIAFEKRREFPNFRGSQRREQTVNSQGNKRPWDRQQPGKSPSLSGYRVALAGNPNTGKSTLSTL